MAGVLLDPKGHQAEAIDENEYNALRSHLQIMRSLDYQEHQSILSSVVLDYDFMLRLKGKGIPRNRPLLSAVAMGFKNDNLAEDHTAGIIVHQKGELCEELTEPEIAALWDTLKTLRAGGWFAQWLEMQVSTIGNGNQPDDKHPSPLKIIGTLTDAVDQYEREIDAAREMITRRPDILIPVPPTPELTAQSTRSPRKGSARAHSKRSKATTHTNAA